MAAITYTTPTLGCISAVRLVEVYRTTGKAFVPDSVLSELEGAWSQSTRAPDEDLADALLEVLVDRAIGRFHYDTYLALRVLMHGAVYGPRAPLTEAASDMTAIIVALMDEVIALESLVASGMTVGTRNVVGPAKAAQRVRIARLVQRSATSLHLEAAADAASGTPPATPPDRLDLSLLPMTREHDERLFIRVLQASEATFNITLAAVAQARRMLLGGERAVPELGIAARSLSVASALLRLLTTMPPAHFLLFRDATDGSSALGSRAFKSIELLCRVPDPSRIDDGALSMVPELRFSPQEETLSQLVASLAAGPSRDEVVDAALRFGRSWSAWKKAHYGVARLWVDEAAPGTGGTDGLAYLARDLTAPLLDLEETCR